MGFIVILGLILILLILPDAYIFYGVLGNISWVWRALFLLPTLCLLIVAVKLFVIGDTSQANFNIIFWLTLCWVLPVVFFTLVSLVGRGVGIVNPDLRNLFDWIALSVSCVVLGIGVFGSVYGWRKVTVEEVSLTYTNLPEAFNGYRIVQLSDFHIGTYSLSPKTVGEIVDRVNSLEPDLVVFTGDLVNSQPEEIDEFVSLLGSIKAPDGVVSILGNHDYCLYRNYKGTDDSAEKSLTRLVEKERNLGWHLLLNESYQVRRGNDSIAVIGVENSGGKNFIDRSDLSKALAGVPQNEFKILLSHDPSHWKREVLKKSDIDLTLSGHTHAMQFKMGGFSPSKWAYSEWGGLYESNGRHLHVNTGTGGNVAFRFGAYPQISLITLATKQNK